jgi:DNA-binding PadR family transcriptional regulator
LSIKKQDNGPILVEHSNSRWGTAINGFLVRIEDTENGGVKVEYVGEAEEFLKDQRLGQAKELILSLLSVENWKPRQEIITAGTEQRITAKVIDEALKEMVKEGSIERENKSREGSRGGRQAFFRLTDTQERKCQEEFSDEGNSEE